MKNWYKLCPFCANEIKKEAIKCQFCHEFLDNNSLEDRDKNENVKDELLKHVETHEIKNKELNLQPSLRGRRFWAAFFDYLIDLTIIWWIYNLVIAIRKWRTFGFDLMGIKFVSEDQNTLTLKQKFWRFLLYRPVTAWIIVIIFWWLWLLFGFNSVNIITILVYIFGIFNTVEWFFKSPTFYEKKLWIKKIQWWKIKWWGIFIVIILLLALWKLVNLAQNAQMLQKFKNARTSWYDSVIDGDAEKWINSYNQMKDIINNTPNQYSDFYSEIFKLAEKHQKDLNLIWSLEYDVPDFKNTQKLNQLISNYRKYKNVQNDYVNSVEKLMTDLVKEYNLDTTTEEYTWPYGNNAWMKNEKKLAKAESDYADFNIEFLSYLLQIQNDFYVDTYWEIYFYEWWYSMNKYNEYIQRFVDEENKYNKIVKECSEFTKARAEYRKNKLNNPDYIIWWEISEGIKSTENNDFDKWLESFKQVNSSEDDIFDKELKCQSYLQQYLDNEEKIRWWWVDEDYWIWVFYSPLENECLWYHWYYTLWVDGLWYDVYLIGSVFEDPSHRWAEYERDFESWCHRQSDYQNIWYTECEWTNLDVREMWRKEINRLKWK